MGFLYSILCITCACVRKTKRTSDIGHYLPSTKLSRRNIQIFPPTVQVSCSDSLSALEASRAQVVLNVSKDLRPTQRSLLPARSSESTNSAYNTSCELPPSRLTKSFMLRMEKNRQSSHKYVNC